MVVCHVTRYCNVIGQHSMVQQDTACILSSPDPSFFLAEVGLACKTNQGGVTPIDSIVTAATAGQNFDWLSSAV